MPGATERRRYQRGEKAGVTARGDYESKDHETLKGYKTGGGVSTTVGKIAQSGFNRALMSNPYTAALQLGTGGKFGRGLQKAGKSLLSGKGKGQSDYEWKRRGKARVRVKKKK